MDKRFMDAMVELSCANFVEVGIRCYTKMIVNPKQGIISLTDGSSTLVIRWDEVTATRIPSEGVVEFDSTKYGAIRLETDFAK